MKQAYNIEKMTLICQPILSVSTQEEFMNLQAMVQSSYSNSEFNHDSCELTDLIMEMEHIRFEKEWMQFVLGGDMSGNTSGEYVQGQMPYIQNIQFIVKKPVLRNLCQNFLSTPMVPIICWRRRVPTLAVQSKFKKSVIIFKESLGNRKISSASGGQSPSDQASAPHTLK